MKIFDSHFHIIDFKFPVVENNGYTPPEFTAKDYNETRGEFGITGGAIVSGSFQAFDQTYLKDSLDKLGDNFFGVANIPNDISNEEIEQTLFEKNILITSFYYATSTKKNNRVVLNANHTLAQLNALINSFTED